AKNGLNINQSPSAIVAEASSVEAKRHSFAREATGLVRELSTRDVLVYNLSNMALPLGVILMFFGASIYQGVNYPLAIVIALPGVLVMGLIYYLFSVAFPRTGGDYVWVS